MWIKGDLVLKNHGISKNIDQHISQYILKLQWKLIQRRDMYMICALTLSMYYIPTAMSGSYTLQFLVVSGGHMRRQVTGDTTPFRRPVITNFRAAARPFSTEGWSGFTTGSWPIISESEILGGGTSDTTGNFNFLSEAGPGSESICNVGCTCIS